MDTAIELIAAYGQWIYPIIFALTFLEGETVVIIAGYAAQLGFLDEVLLLLAAWGGSFLGDQLWFHFGRRFGPALIGRFPRLRPNVETALALLRRYDAGFIMSFRFIFGVRTLSSFAVGVAGVGYLRFAVLNFIAAGLWAASFIAIGYAFAEASEAVLGEELRHLSIATLILFLMVVWVLFGRVGAQARRVPRPPSDDISRPE